MKATREDRSNVTPFPDDDDVALARGADRLQPVEHAARQRDQVAPFAVRAGLGLMSIREPIALHHSTGRSAVFRGALTAPPSEQAQSHESGDEQNPANSYQAWEIAH
jgi:hypothetical protein